MLYRLSLRFGVLLALVVARPASGQVLIETGHILTPKTKDLGQIIDKATTGPKVINGQPAGQPSPSSPSRPSSTARTPADPLAPFTGDGEDPSAVLDINAEVLTRLATALSAESAKREQTSSLTKLKYNDVGAEAGGFTARQYFILKARVGPYCEAVSISRRAVEALTLPYLPTETMAMKPKCSELIGGLKRNM